MNEFDLNGVPMGFGMALSQNMAALEKFSAMSKAEQEAIINGTHNIHSKKEMKSYVNNLTDTGFTM